MVVANFNRNAILKKLFMHCIVLSIVLTIKMSSYFH